MTRLLRAAGLLAAGLAQGLTFAPGPLPDWSLAPVQILALACLSVASTRASRARSAFAQGWIFSFGTYALGFYWIFISLHTYGYMAAPLAAAGVAALAAFMALYPALACLLARRLRSGNALINALTWAASWVVFEWLRGVVLTGFSWLDIGYAHVDSPLAGWAPITGVLGMAFMAALLASALGSLWPSSARANTQAPRRADASPASMSMSMSMSAAHAITDSAPALPAAPAWRVRRARLALAVALLAAVAGGWFLQGAQWSAPVGPPLAMRLVQGNVGQSEKFDPAMMQDGIARHMRLAASGPAPGTPGAAALIVLPETVLPLFQDQFNPALWQTWINLAASRDATIVMGIPLRERLADGRTRYTNSAIGFDRNTPVGQIASGHLPMRYDKRHLVPFGEYVPTGFRWFVDAMSIPLGDFDRGAPRQQPFPIGGQQLALDICYEDLFGEELLPALRPEGPKPGATILVNISNLGWFGDSWALSQHLQIARLRTLETARPMVTDTNTGITAAIDEHGRVLARLPTHQAGVLAVSVQGTTGYTPFARLGNTLPLSVSVLMLAMAWRRDRRRRRLQRQH